MNKNAQTHKHTFTFVFIVVNVNVSAMDAVIKSYKMDSSNETKSRISHIDIHIETCLFS